MTGALIASITAFLVAGLTIGTTLIWMTPTIVGTLYIIYWNKKIMALKSGISELGKSNSIITGLERDVERQVE